MHKIKIISTYSWRGKFIEAQIVFPKVTNMAYSEKELKQEVKRLIKLHKYKKEDFKYKRINKPKEFVNCYGHIIKRKGEENTWLK